jgi:hypothetical protein
LADISRAVARVCNDPIGMSRMLILGIVGLSGLGLVVQMVGIHGATDERAAIRRAVRAPLRDLRRRDARALCDDFTPTVAAALTGSGGGCAGGVGRLFRLGAGAAEYVPSGGLLASGRFEVRAIHRRGDSATADSLGPGTPGPDRRWRLALVGGRWRIAMPAELEIDSDCTRHPFGARGCLDVLALRLGRTH